METCILSGFRNRIHILAAFAGQSEYEKETQQQVSSAYQIGSLVILERVHQISGQLRADQGAQKTEEGNDAVVLCAVFRTEKLCSQNGNESHNHSVVPAIDDTADQKGERTMIKPEQHQIEKADNACYKQNRFFCETIPEETAAAPNR